jgi:hypothetical protein
MSNAWLETVRRFNNDDIPANLKTGTPGPSPSIPFPLPMPFTTLFGSFPAPNSAGCRPAKPQPSRNRRSRAYLVCNRIEVSVTIGLDASESFL